MSLKGQSRETALQIPALSHFEEFLLRKRLPICILPLAQLDAV
jgi:hypothetical protein